jgi:hypothetical protein
MCFECRELRSRDVPLKSSRSQRGLITEHGGANIRDVLRKSLTLVMRMGAFSRREEVPLLTAVEEAWACFEADGEVGGDGLVDECFGWESLERLERQKLLFWDGES